MERREAIKLLGAGILPFLFFDSLKGFNRLTDFNALKSADFGKFNWGVSSAAFQIEGAWDSDGKGASIWDTFSHKHGNIKDKSNADTACDFYHRYPEDIELIRQLGFNSHRFSISWSRVIPEGHGQINQKGIDFYNKVIDTCLEKNIEPWITLYHWDLPQALEDKGGWTNRDIIDWFNDYTAICAKAFGDRVKQWIVLNEPFGFTSLGYAVGIHAPGRLGLKNFLPAVHHAAMCQASGARILRNEVRDSRIGTALSCSPIDPYHPNIRDENAARRLDALFNRLFIEPSLGMGYPFDDLHFLKKMEKYILKDDEKKLQFDFDFIGLQNYFRIVTDFSLLIPYVWANQIPPAKRKVAMTEMKWEVYPEGMYRCIKQFSKYPIKEIVITENGAAFPDTLMNGQIFDKKRIEFFEKYLAALLKAKQEGAKITGYFVWSLLDNFEWSEGYRPKFGLVNVDFATQQRIIKESGQWFKKFLN
jgi:beta-glucosidase